jgi:hypothetical protein
MDAAKVELMRALGRVVRGLSTLFWGLPLTAIVYVETARTQWLDALGALGCLPPMVASLLLCYGLHQLHDFQKQERIWQQALHRAEIFAIINAGLSPFLFWWHRFPFLPFYVVCVCLLLISALVFLMQINHVLRRLSAMLPDETLRVETKMFTTLNMIMLLTALAGVAMYAALDQLRIMPRALPEILAGENPRATWLISFVCLMPLGMTLALLWKIKEVIFTSIFEAESERRPSN